MTIGLGGLVFNTLKGRAGGLVGHVGHGLKVQTIGLSNSNQMTMMVMTILFQTLKALTNGNNRMYSLFDQQD